GGWRWRRGWAWALGGGWRGSRARPRPLRRPRAASLLPHVHPCGARPRWNRAGRRLSAAETARWRCRRAARRAEPRSPPRWATLESVAGCAATADRWQTHDARARSTRRRRRARPCERGSPPPVHGQDWKASSLTAAVTRYQFRRARASGPHVVVPLIPHRSFPRKRESGPANSVLLSRGRAQMNSPERQPASVRGKQAL